jgi:hypothetical protein
MSTSFVLTLTYGDPTPAIRDDIGAELRAHVVHACHAFALSAPTFYVDRFTGLGTWSAPDGTTYHEHSGVIVVHIDGTPLPHEDRAMLIHQLRTMTGVTARKHDQDAIGFILADIYPEDTTLVLAHEGR